MAHRGPRMRSTVNAGVDPDPRGLHAQGVVVPLHHGVQRAQRPVQSQHFEIPQVLRRRPGAIAERQEFSADVLVDGPNRHAQLGRDLPKTGTTRSRQKHPLPSKGNPLFFPDMGWSSSRGLLLGNPPPGARTFGGRCLLGALLFRP